MSGIHWTFSSNKPFFMKKKQYRNLHFFHPSVPCPSVPCTKKFCLEEVAVDVDALVVSRQLKACTNRSKDSSSKSSSSSYTLLVKGKLLERKNPETIMTYFALHGWKKSEIHCPNADIIIYKRKQQTCLTNYLFGKGLSSFGIMCNLVNWRLKRQFL